MKEAISLLSASVCVMFCLNSGGVVQSVSQKVASTVHNHVSADGKEDSNVKALMKAIVLQESSGDYTLVNRDSGAIGLAQLMPFNVGPWSLEAGEGNVTPTQFRYDKALQLRVIKFKIRQYYLTALKKAKGDKQIAAMMVAAAWYSGQMSKYSDTRPQPYGGTMYPSINYYSNKAYKSAVSYGYR
jgi:hypothetical protein